MTPFDLKKVAVPTLPVAIARILELANDPNVDIAILCKAVEQDPAITSRLLQLSNSSPYSLSRQVTNVRQAIVLLGLRTVRMAIYGSAIAGIMPSSRKAGTLAYCWRRILTNASGCRLAAPIFGLNADDAYLAGMMQDIATLILAEYADDEYRSMFREIEIGATEVELHELERERFGTTHAHVGEFMLQQWEFPAQLVEAVARHHEVDLTTRRAFECASLAAEMAAVERISSFVLHPTQTNFERFNEIAVHFGDGTSEGCARMDLYLQELEMQVEEMATLLEMTLSESNCYEKSLQAARADAVPSAESDNLMLAQASPSTWNNRF